jgi:HPt (histidine-containing phosphotransfer) domain-containing protein
MTADVILGVREKCERSGMYHYISKPFHPERFIETVRNLILRQSPSRGEGEPVLDRALGLRNMGGNEALYREVLQAYLKENRDTADRLDEAIREGRHEDAADIVHKITSSSGSIGAKALQDAATALHSALKEGTGERILPLQCRFTKLLRKLLEEMETSERPVQ